MTTHALMFNPFAKSSNKTVTTEEAPDTAEKPPKAGRISLPSYLRIKKSAAKGLTSISIAHDGISICRVFREKDEPVLDICEFKPCMQSERALALNDLIKSHGLSNAKCTTVLDPGFYSIHLVDGPNVQPSEMKAAIRWRIKELIDYDIDDTVYDIFDVPGRNLRGQGGRMMYAVVARASEIQQRMELYKSAGLQLSVVDIPELSLRNIASLLPQNKEGVAILHLTQQSGIITLICNSTLYVARTVNIGTRKLRNALTKKEKDDDFGELTSSSISEFQNYINNIVLELERSLEYYERHSSNPPITNLFITPLESEVPGLTTALSESLSISVNILNINHILNCTKNISDNLQAHTLFTVGAALRHD